MGKVAKNIEGVFINVGIIVGTILFILFFLKRSLWLNITVFLYLIFKYISVIAMFVTILFLLPLLILRKTRGISAVSLLIAADIWGATTWLWSFVLSYLTWGTWGVIIGIFIFGIGVIPVAILGTLFNGKLIIVGELIFLVLLTLGMRFLALSLIAKIEND